MSVVRDMARAYVAPRVVFRRRVAGAESEATGLVILMTACLLIFVAQAPRLQRMAFETGEEFQPLLGGALFAWMFIMPLAAYAISWITHLIARLFTKSGDAFSARMAFFWALLVASPLWLLWGLTAGFIGDGIELSIIGAVALAAFVLHWLVNLWTTYEARP